MNNRTRLPLPEPVAYEAYAAMYGPELSYSKKGIKSLLVKLYTAKQMREYADAENAALLKEVERLKTVPMKYRRMTFNAQLQDDNIELMHQMDDLRKKNATLQSQFRVLREVVESAAAADEFYDHPLAIKRLAVMARKALGGTE